MIDIAIGYEGCEPVSSAQYADWAESCADELRAAFGEAHVTILPPTEPGSGWVRGGTEDERRRATEIQTRSWEAWCRDNWHLVEGRGP